jgi:hypothetical protein
VPTSQSRPQPRITLAWLRKAPLTVSVPIAAAALGIGQQTLYDAIARGNPPVRAITVGCRLRVPTADLIALLEPQAAPARSKLAASA